MAWATERNLIKVDNLILREHVTKGGTITIDARPAEEGGVTISFNGEVVADGLNTMEVFIMLAGMMKNGPRNVGIVMGVVSENFTHHYLTGYRATR